MCVLLSSDSKYRKFSLVVCKCLLILFQSIIAGDFVMAMASISLARIRDEEVVSVVSQITEDLVRGMHEW